MKHDLSSLPEWSRPWAEHRIAQVSHDISGEQWSGLGDWLTALPLERPKMPAKLHKLTMAQALQASALWHEDMALRAERIRADQADFGGDPDAIQVLADGGQGWRWVRVTSPEGLDYEGNAMGHCVGRGGYDTGKTIISLRDKHNMPHCTIEWDEDSRSVEQVQGRANCNVVEKYHESVVSFINGLEPLAVQNAGKFGHVFVENKLVHWSKLPDGLTLEELYLEGCIGLRHLPDGLNVKYLYLMDCTSLTHLPDGLTTEHLDIRGCTGLTNLPHGLTAQSLNLRGCVNLTHLPDGLTAQSLNLSGCTGLTHLPNETNVKQLHLENCTGLTSLPDGLNLGNLNLSGCTGLTHLPDGLNVRSIYLNRCTGLTHLPDGLTAKYLNLRNCTSLTHLPNGLSVETLNLSGCTSLTHLPDGLSTEILNLSGCTGLRHMPDGLTAEFIYLNDCTSLTHLPDGLTAEHLNISGCTGLTYLPDGLNKNCRVIGGDHLVKQFVNAPKRLT